MNLQRFKRCSALRVEAPPLGSADCAMADPIGIGTEGRTATCTEARNSNPSGVRVSNRVSQCLNVSLRALFAIVMLAFVAQISRATLTYKGSLPESGTEISSLDIKLVFDYNDIIESGKEYGIGHWGIFNERRPRPATDKYTALYEGTGEEKVLLSRIFTTNIDGTSEEFTIGNEVTLSFPGIVPTPGKTYTIYSCNTFLVYEKGSKSAIANSSIEYINQPLELTFTVGKASGEQLVLEECSIQNGANISDFSSVSFTFNKDVKAVEGKSVVIVDDNGESIYSTSLVTNGKILTAEFEPTLLLNKHIYSITLPEGTVEDAADASLKNSEFSTTVNGVGFNTFGLKSNSPEDNSTSIFSQISAEFDLPEGYKMMTSMGVRSNFKASLYKNEVAEENLISILDGTISEDGRSLTWSVEYVDPSTKYVLYIPKHQFSAWQDKNEDYANDEVLITLNTPSVEESGIPQMEFQDPVIGVHGESNQILSTEKPVAYINRIEIALKDLKYMYDGKENNPTRIGSAKAYIYEVTQGKDVLLKEIAVATTARENPTQYYTVISAVVSSYFFEGHKYKFVIPAGSFTVSNPTLHGYVKNPELSYEFYGAAPEKVELISTSVQDGDEMSELFNVVYKFNGEFALNPDAKAHFKGVNNSDRMLTSSVVAGETTVVAHIYNGATGGPMPLLKGYQYSVTLPAGAIYYLGDENIKNEEIVLNITPVEKKPEVVEPEFVKVKVIIADTSDSDGIIDLNNVVPAHTYSFDAVKDKKFSVQLAHDNWIVKELFRDGLDVHAMMGDSDIYTTPAIKGDTEIVANVAYKDPLVTVDKTTDAAAIPDSNIKVSDDGEHIIVVGLSGSEEISIYSISGILVTKTLVNVGENEIKFNIPSGNYIVVINNKGIKTAVKIKH